VKVLVEEQFKAAWVKPASADKVPMVRWSTLFNKQRPQFTPIVIGRERRKSVTLSCGYLLPRKPMSNTRK
jgi:hypothetical protein